MEANSIQSYVKLYFQFISIQTKFENKTEKVYLKLEPNNSLFYKGLLKNNIWLFKTF